MQYVNIKWLGIFGSPRGQLVIITMEIKLLVFSHNSLSQTILYMKLESAMLSFMIAVT